MITIAVLLLLVPFVALRDYFGKIAQLDPRSAALTKASHGVAMLALGLWAYLERDRLGLRFSIGFRSRCSASRPLACSGW